MPPHFIADQLIGKLAAISSADNGANRQGLLEQARSSLRSGGSSLGGQRLSFQLPTALLASADPLLLVSVNAFRHATNRSGSWHPRVEASNRHPLTGTLCAKFFAGRLNSALLEIREIDYESAVSQQLLVVADGLRMC